MNTCLVTATAFPDLKCTTASPTVAGGQCTECAALHWPTALSTDSATLGTNLCKELAVDNIPGLECAVVSQTVAGGKCTTCNPNFFPGTLSVVAETLNTN